jgi:hypothetical protein
VLHMPAVRFKALRNILCECTLGIAIYSSQL